MSRVSVRYIVDDVPAAISFYCQRLGFVEEMHPAATFAIVTRQELRLLLSAPSAQAGGGQVLEGSAHPVPGGWNRISLQVDELDQLVDRLRREGVTCRTPIIDGVGGRQVIVDDPSGNPVELFQPKLDQARNG
ncbi:MAG: VOC family protein [Candidatus Dormibacteria bacterium]